MEFSVAVPGVTLLAWGSQILQTRISMSSFGFSFVTGNPERQCNEGMLLFSGGYSWQQHCVMSSAAFWIVRKETR